MADFCKECSIETFGEDFRDMAGQTTQEDMNKGVAFWGMCEGCGYIPVDPDGKRIGPDRLVETMAALQKDESK